MSIPCLFIIDIFWSFYCYFINLFIMEILVFEDKDK